MKKHIKSFDVRCHCESSVCVSNQFDKIPKRLCHPEHHACYLANTCYPEFVLGSKTRRAAFSLVEMLMALLVASLLMAALAPVMTRKMNETMTINGNMNPTRTPQTKTIDFLSPECSELKTDADGTQYCEGEYVVPPNYNGIIKVTVIGAGGGGGTAPTAGYVEYTTANTHSFPVPAGVNQIEATIVEGGGGGGAGYINPKIKGYAWTHSGTLDRTYVSTSDVSENVTNIKLSGGTYSSSYAHATATLNANVIKYVAGDKLFITLAGGGGGGGRGYAGTGGGGGAAYKRHAVTISTGNSYDVEVGLGGQGHSCNGSGGCGGSASRFGGLVMAGGGGGGGWGKQGTACYATNGENGGSGAILLTSACSYVDLSPFNSCTGGLGGSPGGLSGLSDNQRCGQGVTVASLSGANGGGSTFGVGGVYPSGSGKGYGSGGCGGGANPDAYGHGAAGFVAAEWVEYGNGGSGGGGASMIPLRRVNVAPKENLSVIIGGGGLGGAAGSVTSSVTSFTQGFNGGYGKTSYLKRGSDVLIKTSSNTESGAANCGSCGGGAAGICNGGLCCAGWIGGCHATGHTSANGLRTNVNYLGFTVDSGKSAGNTSVNSSGASISSTYTIDDKAGDGGQNVIFGRKTCEAGKGSQTLGVAGGNATGYGGCGGGGGYGLAKGGDGAPGYARISWNKYWSTAESAYKLANGGSGGGGASGNVMSYTVSVIGGQAIKIRIGKGGEGAKVVSNSIVSAMAGGTTIFGDTAFGEIKAGGGGGGTSPDVDATGAFVNGRGGVISGICSYKSKNYLNNVNYCKKGVQGNSPASSTNIGAKGADFVYNTVNGTGGGGGIVDTGDNANGKNAEGFASGGGGASLRDVGQVSSSATGNITNNQNKGGNGGNGKIIIEWWE